MCIYVGAWCMDVFSSLTSSNVVTVEWIKSHSTNFCTNETATTTKRGEKWKTKKIANDFRHRPINNSVSKFYCRLRRFYCRFVSLKRSPRLLTHTLCFTHTQNVLFFCFVCYYVLQLGRFDFFFSQFRFWAHFTPLLCCCWWWCVLFSFSILLLLRDLTRP